MLKNLRRYLWEQARCTRHNLLHLRVFRISFRGGMWHVRADDVDMLFPYYPFLAFHDIEGYLQEGAWRLEPGMTVLDVGGCYGEFALYAANCVGPTGRVIMLEPDADNIEVARRTLELNKNPRNLQIVQSGLWSHPGKLRFNVGHGPVTSVAGLGENVTGGHTIEIDVESLSSLVERLNVEHVDFVKMDIEGAELEVISAAGELPPKYKPRYAVASYHIINGKRTADLLPAAFAKIGYESSTGNPRHLTTWSWPALASER